MRMTRKNNNNKILQEMSKYKRYCKCGHSVIFTPSSKATKKICTWCGTCIYKNDYEEFKENIKKILK